MFWFQLKKTFSLVYSGYTTNVTHKPNFTASSFPAKTHPTVLLMFPDTGKRRQSSNINPNYYYVIRISTPFCPPILFHANSI